MAMPTAIGKRVAEHLYVHLSAIPRIDDSAVRTLITETLGLLTAQDAVLVNVAKIHTRTHAISLLEYAEFDADPFPRLTRSWVRTGPESPSIALRTYEQSSNPPILHRKELLVAPNYPGRSQWEALTHSAEALGLFDETATIGFLLNWDRLIASKGLQLLDGQFLPLANDLSLDPGESLASPNSAIQRHRTALVRSALSVPVQLLFRHDLLQAGDSFFDYGCGRGGDMTRLAASGYTVGGWDPHFAPTAAIKPADVVNLGFVINVIENPAERLDALKAAFLLTQKVLSVGVMLSGSHSVGPAYSDGVLSGRNTFQKYFTQAEIKEYLETVLDREAHMVGPGIAFVFADADCEARFHSRRYRTRNVAPRLLATQRAQRPRVEPRVRVRTAKTPEPLSLVALPILEDLWRQALDLGRLPDENEIEDIDRLRSAFSSYGKALRTLEASRDRAMLESAAQTRKDDLDVYFALLYFTRRADRKTHDTGLQKDIRHFYGTLARASEAGMQLLRNAADPATLYAACVVASERGLGWLDAQASLQLEANNVERLPAVLRAYVACGIQLCGGISDFQLIKIHIASGKVSLMDYVDYASPIPRLRRRLKLNLRRQDLQVFEYGSVEYPLSPLHQKSRFMTEDAEGYAEQVAFDEKLESLGLAASKLDYDELLRALDRQRYEIAGASLRRSTRAPELDDRCGRFLRYRDLVECGETQRRLAIANQPLRVESYNALYDLAVNVLDPVIDYFGGIKLTYGLCSAALGKHIKSRVAPKLDQHAASERNSRGGLICSRGGAACDFLVEDEHMAEVADWIISNTAFDRLYYYGADRPLHISYGPGHSRQAFTMKASTNGSLIPSRYLVSNRRSSNLS